MRLLHKILLNVFFFSTILVLFYYYQLNGTKPTVSVNNSTASKLLIHDEVTKHILPYSELESGVEKFDFSNHTEQSNDFNVWCIFTKVSSNIQMKHKFRRFFMSLIQHSSVFINLHLIVDSPSKVHALEVLKSIRNHTNKTFDENFYEVNDLAENLEDIISTMQPFFSSQPGTYYSDALFFLSLGLHRIAEKQKRAIMFDADTKLLTDVYLLFKEFENFDSSALFGLAPELSPVYRHILYLYRSKFKDTLFGDPVTKGGFPGLNSGVIMFNFDHIRNSVKYNSLLKSEEVQKLTKKYEFKGHLGDQDFYTLLGMEYPSMIYVLGCEWNRQLCTWWKNHGYQDIFDEFFRCDNNINVYHGNCNTAIPNSSILT